MAASDHVNGEQLKMFMTPREIMDQYAPWIADRRPTADNPVMESTDELWGRKLAESKKGVVRNAQTLYDSVAETGVQKPVHLATNVEAQGDYRDDDRPPILGGHHRIIAAMSSRPDDLMPVVHHESAVEAQRAPMQRYYRYT